MTIPNANRDKFGNKVVTVRAPRNMVTFIEENLSGEIARMVNEKLAEGTLTRDFRMVIVSKEIPAKCVSVLKGSFFLMDLGRVRAVLEIQVKVDVERFGEILPENLYLKCAIDFRFQAGIEHQVLFLGRSYTMEETKMWMKKRINKLREPL